jgi:hypothetical protein
MAALLEKDFRAAADGVAVIDDQHLARRWPDGGQTAACMRRGGVGPR